MVVRAILILACSISGFFIAYLSYPASHWWTWPLGFILGLLIALFVIKTEQEIRKISLRVILV